MGKITTSHIYVLISVATFQDTARVMVATTIIKLGGKEQVRVKSCMTELLVQEPQFGSQSPILPIWF